MEPGFKPGDRLLYTYVSRIGGEGALPEVLEVVGVDIPYCRYTVRLLLPSEHRSGGGMGRSDGEPWREGFSFIHQWCEKLGGD